MNLDERLSHLFAEAAQRTALGKKISTLCAAPLIWFLFGMFLFWMYQTGITTRIAYEAVLSVAVAWMVTIALEYAIGRHRPFQQEGRRLSIGMLWVPPSFPSGHATLAFAIATVMVSNATGDGTSWILFTIAVFISLGRVAVRVHYFTDVIAGAGVGSVVTFVLMHLL